jgi:uncharacterized repeat protein (TIGR03803 family)
MKKMAFCPAVVVLLCGFALGQQYSVLYNFCSAPNCADGGAPRGKLVFDSAGNLYGTTAGGGAYGSGTAFELSSSNGVWTESVLYSFCVNDARNCPDGYNPVAGLTIDKMGNLYGTTQGGGSFGLGTVFELTPPSNPGGPWTESVLWSFGAQGDGQNPLSHLIFDASGNLYGTTSRGGAYGGGTVFQVVPAGQQWSENILFSFGPDAFNGYNPQAGVAFDKSGNLYGTTSEGGTENGFGWGVVYKLSPNSQLPWTETVLFRFAKNIGANPLSAVNFDALGNLYGTLSDYGSNNGGGVFRLTPQGREHTLLFSGSPGSASPAAGVFVSGNTLYGTAQLGGTGQDGGTIFKIQGTTETVLYSFCSQPSCADGSQPEAALISRAKSLFGTTATGGTNGKGGVVFEISETAPGGK